MKRLFQAVLILAILAVACIILNPTEAKAATIDDLTFTLNEDGQSYSVEAKSTAIAGELTIPATFNNKPVTTIHNEAFWKCASLTSVTIPDSVTTIDNRAFYYCTRLAKINIPNSVTTIGSSAFYYCTSLTSVTIPDSVTTIGNGAFAYCTKLREITIPSCVTTIDNYMFCGCTSLTRVTIPDSVTSIGAQVFLDCTSLTGVTIPDSVTTIGSHAFNGCTNLTNITIPSSVTTIGKYAFYKCYSLTEITIPSGVTIISDDTFSYCTSLTGVTIPSSVTTIGNSAFNNCIKLTDVYYTGTLTQWNAISIGWGNTYLKNATLHLVDDCSAYGHTEEIIHGKTPTATESGLTDGKKCATCGEILVEQKTIPPTVIEGYLTFTLNDDDKGYMVSKCDTSATGELIIPATCNGKSVTAIGNSAFSYCTSLTGVTIPDSVTTIGSYAFECCWGLTNVTIGNNVTTIGYSAFYYCSNLTSVIIPDSVTTIGTTAFQYCVDLTSVTIPDSVTTIRSAAFISTSLTDVYYTGTREQWNAISVDVANNPLQNATLHFTQCETNGHTYTDTHDTTCEVCGYTRELPTTAVNNGKVTVNAADATVERMYVFYLGDKTVADIENWKSLTAAAKDISGSPYGALGYKTYVGLDAINGIVLSEGGNYVLRMQYVDADGNRQLMSDAFTVAAAPKPEAAIDGNKVTLNAGEGNTVEKVYVFYVGNTAVDDINNWNQLVATGQQNPGVFGLAGYRTFQGEKLNNIALPENGNYILRVQYTDGTTTKYVSLNLTVDAAPTVAVENGKVAVDVKGYELLTMSVFYLADGTEANIGNWNALKAASANIAGSPYGTAGYKIHKGESVINEIQLATQGNYILRLTYQNAQGETFVLTAATTI